MYSLRKNTKGQVLLYKDDTLLTDLDGAELLTVEFILNFKLYKKTYIDLTSFLDEIEDTKNLSNLDINLHKAGVKFQIEFDKSSDTLEHKISINLPYTKELYKFEQGLSNFDYVKDFMPLWSTAYKNIYSNHTKTFEPLFTNVLNIKYNVDNYIKNLPIQSIKNVIFYKRDTKTEQLSDKNINYLINKHTYTLNSESLVDFGNKFNSIYIELSESCICKLRIKGIFNNSFVKEDVVLSDTSLIILKNKYNKIYSIDLLDFYDNLIPDLEVKLSNVIYVDSFYNESSIKRTLEATESKIILKEGGVPKYVFNNTIPDYQGMFVTKDDNILSVYNGVLYTSKLNLKLDLDIPENLTYNNTNYIETIYLNSNEYEIAIDAYRFLSDVETERCCISIYNNNEQYFLNSNFELESGSEDIFIYLKDLRDKIYINLELDSDVEYVIISIKDSNSFYKKSNIIVQPFIEYIPNLKLKLNEQLVILNENFYLFNSIENQLIPLLITPSQMSMIEDPP